MERIGVLFVCLGNICRSPLAEGVFRTLVAEAGLQEWFRVDSAGTSGYHLGEGPDPRACAVASSRGVVLAHTARRLRAEDLERFEYVLAMDADNLSRIQSLAAGSRLQARVALLREFEPGAPPAAEVPDPYYDEDHGFEVVHDMVDRACRGLLRQICAERRLPC